MCHGCVRLVNPHQHLRFDPKRKQINICPVSFSIKQHIVILLSIVIVLCTIVINICFDVEKYPGLLLENSKSYESMNSHYCLSRSGELTGDFKSYLIMI